MNEHAYELALSEAEAARDELHSHAWEKALAHLTDCTRIIAGQPGRPEWDKLLLEIAFDLLSLRTHLLADVETLPDLLQKTGAAALRQGDQRSLARCYLFTGAISLAGGDFTNGLQALAKGLSQVDALGDSDIMEQAAEFRGLYYFIQGMYKDAVEYFDIALRTGTISTEGGVVSFLPEHISSSLLLGYSSALLGQFHRAIGVLDSHWRRARMAGDRTRASFYQSLLGIVLLIMGRRQEAYTHIQAAHDEAVAHQNIPALHVCQKGLSYYYYFEGRLDKAYAAAQNTVHAEAIGYQYYWPTGLELLHALAKKGFDPIPELDFEQEMEKVLGGVNLHLRGAGLRIRAQQAMERGENREVVLSLLEASEADLLKTGDPVELAKTRCETARLMLAKGNRQAAVKHALNAWEGLSGYGQNFFPDDLMPLLKVGVSPRPVIGRQDFLDRFLDLMNEFVPSTDHEELLARLVAVTSRFFEAERGGLFWFSGNTDSPRPVLRAGYNLSREDVKAEDFRSSFGLIFKTYRSSQVLVIRPVLPSPDLPETRGALTVICLPVELEGVVRGVIYLDNSYIVEEGTNIGREVLFRVSKYVSASIERIFRYSGLIETQKAFAAVQPAPSDGTEAEYQILGESPVMRSLLAKADQAAYSEASILIMGETGAGKELLARRVHSQSARRDHPFVPVDIVSIPENLLESELFGHEKGAFTGASKQKPGRMELAHAGTLFIDEIGDVPPAVQVKLLRVLQEKAFVRVGGTRTISSDFRLVAATNKDLRQEVGHGRFREDLYYRLNVVSFTMPPLRERGDDIITLANAFLRRYTHLYSRNLSGFSAEDTEKLMKHAWPGNVRELRNVVERAVILSQGGQVGLSLPMNNAPSSGFTFDDIITFDEMERRYIRYVLSKTGGRIGGPGGAAELLGMKRTTLQSRMKKLCMERV